MATRRWIRPPGRIGCLVLLLLIPVLYIVVGQALGSVLRSVYTAGTLVRNCGAQRGMRIFLDNLDYWETGVFVAGDDRFALPWECTVARCGVRIDAAAALRIAADAVSDEHDLAPLRIVGPAFSGVPGMTRGRRPCTWIVWVYCNDTGSCDDPRRPPTGCGLATGTVEVLVDATTGEIVEMRDRQAGVQSRLAAKVCGGDGR